nr:hypothetical protein [Tanacetum cinerariifolium]
GLRLGAGHLPRAAVRRGGAAGLRARPRPLPPARRLLRVLPPAAARPHRPLRRRGSLYRRHPAGHPGVWPAPAGALPAAPRAEPRLQALAPKLGVHAHGFGEQRAGGEAGVVAVENRVRIYGAAQAVVVGLAQAESRQPPTCAMPKQHRRVRTQPLGIRRIVEQAKLRYAHGPVSRVLAEYLLNQFKNLIFQRQPGTRRERNKLEGRVPQLLLHGLPLRVHLRHIGGAQAAALKRERRPKAQLLQQTRVIGRVYGLAVELPPRGH